MGLDNPLHIAFLVLILLLVFGAKRLPELGRSLGSGMREFKQSVTGEGQHQQQTPPALGAPPQQPAAQAPPAQPAPVPVAQPAQVPVAQPAQAPAPAQPQAAPVEHQQQG
jgi:sec-independent protein translocase protein TatA